MYYREATSNAKLWYSIPQKLPNKKCALSSQISNPHHKE
jgi:hypothetical protein